MKLLIIALLFQSIPLAPRIAMDNPASESQVPPKLKKDYDKLWALFVNSKNDAKLTKDLDKFIKKNPNFDPALIIRAYLELHRDNSSAAVRDFEAVLARQPDHQIALSYLAEIMFAGGDYGRASRLYAQLLDGDQSRVELEMKRQKALLMAMENLLQSAARAEQENRLVEAERIYREALLFVPNEPLLHLRLSVLLEKLNRPEDAAAERRIAAAIAPDTAARGGSAEKGKVDELEDLGRWGTEIAWFRQIRNAEVITREQFATIILRFFPQLTEFRQNPQIMTDISEARARLDIQTIVGLGLMDPYPNHTFDPSAPLTRNGFVSAMSRLIRILGLSTAVPPPVPLPDLASSHAQFAEVQLVLAHGLLALQESGRFGVDAHVSGKEAVNAAEQLLRSFQQVGR